MRIYTSVIGVVLVAGLLWAARSPAAEPPPQIPEEMPVLKLSLKDAIEASLDKNPNVRLYKERIEAAPREPKVRARDNMIDGLFRANASRVNLARAMGQVEDLQ